MQWKCFWIGCAFVFQLVITAIRCGSFKWGSQWKWPQRPQSQCTIYFQQSSSLSYILTLSQILVFVHLVDYLHLNSTHLTAHGQRNSMCKRAFVWILFIYDRYKEHEKTEFSFKTQLSIWVNSAVRAEADLNKFLQISSLATVHNQACHFPRNRRVVKITAFEEWKFTHCLFLNRSSNKIDIW